MSAKSPPPPPGHHPQAAEAQTRTTAKAAAHNKADTAGVARAGESIAGPMGNSRTPLYVSFPVNSVMELTLAPHRETVRGLVYCTDEVSNSVVLAKSLQHTTLTSEIRVVNASSVLEKKTVEAGGGTKARDGADSAAKSSEEEMSGSKGGEPEFDVMAEELSLPLPNVNRKALEERERRAIKLAEESFSHINQKATPEGQAVFDRLLKACNEVVWRGETILVLKQIRVDPPYGKEDCKLLSTGEAGAMNEGSLERVKKIVAAASDRG